MLDHFRVFTFWTNPEFQDINHFRTFRLCILDHSKIKLHSCWFQNCYIQENSRISACWTRTEFHVLDLSKHFTCWTLPEFFYSRSFQNFYIMNHSRILKFWTIPEMFQSVHFQNSYTFPHSNFFKMIFWTLENLYILDNLGILNFGPFLYSYYYL